MDFAYPMERNRTALIRIVAALFAAMGLAPGATLDRLSWPLYRRVLRVLRPAESATRRLIAVAAHGMVVELPPPRSKPERPAPGQIIPRLTGRISPPRFQLFDPRKSFETQRLRKSAKVAPRIISFGFGPIAPPFRPQLQAIPVHEPSDSVPAARLFRRLTAITAALDDIPRQAKRLARWQARRARLPVAKFRDPFRPGWPPGYRRHGDHDVDDVLKECMWLARERLAPNTS